MNRKLFLWLGASLVFLIAFIIIVATIITQDEPTEQANSFCDEYPEAVFCTDSNPTTKDIAVDMLTTFIDKYPSNLDDTFCNYYFSGNLQTYCIEQSSMLVPDNFNTVKRSFEIVEIADNVFDVRTYYYSNRSAYTMRIALNDMDGSYHISGMSYYLTPEVVDLALTDEDITTIMTDMLQAIDDSDDTLCQQYFTWTAKEQCQRNELDLEDNVDINQNPVITPIGFNQFQYTATNEDETESITYHITFEDEDGTVKLSKITIIVPEESTTE
jgi:hypothetical protein